MINTIRVHFDKKTGTNSVFVFSDANTNDYAAAAVKKAEELGGRAFKVEVQQWYSDSKIKSCDTVTPEEFLAAQ